MKIKLIKSKKTRKVEADPAEQVRRDHLKQTVKKMKAEKIRGTMALYKKLGITGSIEERRRKLAEYCERTREGD